jgi:hypothetical protein
MNIIIVACDTHHPDIEITSHAGQQAISMPYPTAFIDDDIGAD